MRWAEPIVGGRVAATGHPCLRQPLDIGLENRPVIIDEPIRTCPGNITHGSTDRAGDHIDFDLACIWTGAEAHRRMEEAGEDTVFDYWISDQVSKIRSAIVAAGAAVYHLSGSPWVSEPTYAEWRQGPCHGFQDHSCPVWLCVNGGKATAVVEQFFATSTRRQLGCRLSRRRTAVPTMVTTPIEPNLFVDLIPAVWHDGDMVNDSGDRSQSAGG